MMSAGGNEISTCGGAEGLQLGKFTARPFARVFDPWAAFTEKLEFPFHLTRLAPIISLTERRSVPSSVEAAPVRPQLSSKGCGSNSRQASGDRRARGHHSFERRRRITRNAVRRCLPSRRIRSGRSATDLANTTDADDAEATPTPASPQTTSVSLIHQIFITANSTFATRRCRSARYSLASPLLWRPSGQTTEQPSQEREMRMMKSPTCMVEETGWPLFLCVPTSGCAIDATPQPSERFFNEDELRTRPFIRGTDGTGAEVGDLARS